jgi:AraC-like DNA-binding protein
MGTLVHGERVGLVLRGAGRHEAERGSDFPPHEHPTWEFTYYLSGSIPCPLGEEVHWSQPGMVLMTPPGIVHAEQALTGYANYFLNVETAPRAGWPSVLFDDEHETLRSLFAIIVREWNGRAPDRDEVLSRSMELLRAVLLRSARQPLLTRAERLVREAEAILQDRFAGPVRIRDVARELHVSPSSLRAHFLRLRGSTPMQQLQGLRARHATATIRNSDLSLESVAELCGYNSASHLCRSIKLLTGRTPGSFREPASGRVGEWDTSQLVNRTTG